jgi:predicted nucleotidyltransferase component of viral defense system
VELQGTTLTAEELSQVRERYQRCRGKDLWDVREYASVSAVGAREYRVVRGSSTQDVYRSSERNHATAVRAALNELESENIRAEKPPPVSS